MKIEGLAPWDIMMEGTDPKLLKAIIGYREILLFSGRDAIEPVQAKKCWNSERRGEKRNISDILARCTERKSAAIARPPL